MKEINNNYRWCGRTWILNAAKLHGEIGCDVVAISPHRGSALANGL